MLSKAVRNAFKSLSGDAFEMRLRCGPKCISNAFLIFAVGNALVEYS